MDTHKRDRFLAAFQESGIVSEAAKVAKIARQDHYNWLADDEYQTAFEHAKETAVDSLEAEARRRAKSGSDVLLIFLLKGLRRAVFSERHEITGKDGGPLVTVVLKEGEDVP